MRDSLVIGLFKPIRIKSLVVAQSMNSLGVMKPVDGLTGHGLNRQNNWDIDDPGSKALGAGV